MFREFFIKIFRQLYRAPKPLLTYAVQFPEHEVQVVSHPDGFYLKSQGKFYVMDTWMGSMMSNDVPRWRDSKQGNDRNPNPRPYDRYVTYWNLKVYPTKTEAIKAAINIEMTRDATKREVTRRSTFKEEKVWR